MGRLIERERLGVFGGTFDPPHLGHLILAAEAYQQLGLARILFVLTADPPHKRHQPISLLDDRLALLQAALADNPAFEVSRVDIDRPGPHYTVDTVRLLRAEYPQAEIIYLMGGDSLSSLPTGWYQPQAFIDVCDRLGVMRRPDEHFELDALEAALPGLGAKLEIVEAPLLEIASRQLRRRIASGRPYRYYLPPAVYDLIEARQLYRPKD